MFCCFNYKNDENKGTQKTLASNLSDLQTQLYANNNTVIGVG